MSLKDIAPKLCTPTYSRNGVSGTIGNCAPIKCKDCTFEYTKEDDLRHKVLIATQVELNNSYLKAEHELKENGAQPGDFTANLQCGEDEDGRIKAHYEFIPQTENAYHVLELLSWKKEIQEQKTS